MHQLRYEVTGIRTVKRFDNKTPSILMVLKTRYVIKEIGKEQIVSSVVAIHLGGEGKIQKVEDKWDGKLPYGAIANAFRHVNAVTVPQMINVPKNDKGDAERGN